METKLNVNHQAQADLIFSYLGPEAIVVGYGLGEGINEIANKCLRLIAVEHDRELFNQLVKQVPENVTLLIVEPAGELKPGSDGGWDEFEEYVNAPKSVADFKKADVIIIAGRARVACAEFAEKISHKDTQIFILDYNHPVTELCRDEYFDAEKTLICLNGEFSTYRFVVRSMNLELAEAILKAPPLDHEPPKKVKKVVKTTTKQAKPTVKTDKKGLKPKEKGVKSTKKASKSGKKDQKKK